VFIRQAAVGQVLRGSLGTDRPGGRSEK